MVTTEMIMDVVFVTKMKLDLKLYIGFIVGMIDKC